MNDIIKDFHELTEIPVFQEMVPDKKYMDTEEHLDVLQMNIGRKCNLLCKHCHVNAGPARTEEMSKEVMDACLTFAKEQNIATIEIYNGQHQQAILSLKRGLKIAEKIHRTHTIAECKSLLAQLYQQKNFIQRLKAKKIEQEALAMFETLGLKEYEINNIHE